jgi:Glycosyl transferase family 2/Glycosyl transferases group 1
LSGTLKLRFVASPRGNLHMTELLAALCVTARDAGHDAQLASSTFPELDDGVAYVVIPHEHHGCEPPASWPSLEQRRRTIALCVENPTSQWFEAVCELAPQFPRVLAINRSSVDELRRREIAAEHLQFGYTEHWDRWRGEAGPRPIDVTYLGAADRRRDALVAGYGRWLWHRRTAMLLPPAAPKPSSRPDFLIGATKFAHLRNAKMLVNLHRAGTSSFEWIRVLQAIANGCVVVSEPSCDHAPLVVGEHFVVAAPDSIPHVVEGLLREPERLEAIAAAAHEKVKRELTLAAAVEQLVEAAGALVTERSAPELASALDADRLEGVADHHDPGLPGDRVAIAVNKLSTDTLELRRSIQRVLERAEGRDPDAEPEIVAVTPSFHDARPRVSIAVTLHNYEREVLEALASIDLSVYEDYEVLVLDDASTDGSVAAVREFLHQRPWLPAALLRGRVNRGAGASRNALARRCRGELMFVLDADNLIYPSALGRLVEALDRDPGASFAYPLIAVTQFGATTGLLSRYAWDPHGFAAGNYIDSMAMIRLDDHAALGGFTEDARLHGWEDFHFWCACAASGRRGTLVPEVLADYRHSGHSMLAFQSDMSAAWSLLHAQFPTVVPPRPHE